MAVPKKAYFTVIIVLALTAVLRYAHMAKASSFPVGLRLGELPMSAAGWQGKNVPYPDWLPEELGANEFFIREYTNDRGGAATFYAAYFDARYGGTTHNPDICYPAQGWEIVERSRLAVQVEGADLEVTRMLIQKGLTKQLVLFYFQTGDQTIPELSGYRLRAIVQGILFNKIGAAIVRVSAPVTETVEKTEREEAEFLKAIAPMIEQYIPS